MDRQQLSFTPHFSEKEITRTGAKLKDINFESMYKLEVFRVRIGRRVLFQKNGITTGDHSSEGHKKGKAFDVRFDTRDGKVDFAFCLKALKTALSVGFVVIGLYFNGIEYSFHLEDSEEYRFWRAVKDGKGWKYFGLIADPQQDWRQ